MSTRALIATQITDDVVHAALERGDLDYPDHVYKRDDGWKHARGVFGVFEVLA